MSGKQFRFLRIAMIMFFFPIRIGQTECPDPCPPVCPPQPSMCAAASCGNNAVAPHQSGEDWSAETLDDSPFTIGGSGCYLSCFSAIVGQTPDQTNQSLSSTGAIDSHGNMDGNWAALQYQLNYTEIGTSDAEIENALCNGQVVACVCSRITHDSHGIVCTDAITGDQHFVLVNGEVYDSSEQVCRFTVSDPASFCSKFYLDQYPCVFGVRLFSSQ